ncbi:MAG: carboxylating nicotinate-nucleotide diphosphorylase [Chitinivibrionia bacterium]|nr:carboxylating nicotinate-nucleotide diphosphorylase [Chitinivibrionia bacterium]
MNDAHELDPSSVREAVKAALAEDAAWDDATSGLLRLSGRTVRAEIRCMSHGVMAGLDIAHAAFRAMDPGVTFEPAAHDGSGVRPGQVVAAVRGDAAAIMAAERTALNFLQRLSGIATLTRDYVGRVAHSGATILDTRKTTPLLRSFEKYAVRVGGGENHRSNLRDMVLIKENHIRACGGIGSVAGKLAGRTAPVAVEVEIDSLDLLRDFLGTPVDRIMLDNFTPDDVQAALAMISSYENAHPGYRPDIEVSGGVTLENISRYAVKGVRYISIGTLTHSARALDFTLEVTG